MEPSQAPAPISLFSRNPLCRTVLALGMVLAFTGLLLAGPARTCMDGWTAIFVLLHLTLGASLAPLGLFLAWRSLRWQRGRGPGTPVGHCLTAAFLTGVVLIIAAARGSAASDPVLIAHEAAGCLAVLFAVAALAQRHLPLRPPAGAGTTTGRLSPTVGAMLAGLILLSLFAGAAAMTSAGPTTPQYDPDAYYAHLTATNARQAGNSLFPAGTTLALDPGGQVRPAADCGTAGCHLAEYRQWLGSPHQLAGQTRGYARAAALYAAQRGPIARRWCEGCHAPPALADGRRSVFSVRSSVLDARQSDRSHQSDRSDPRTPDTEARTPSVSLSSEGVNCLACHAATPATELSGNGQFTLRVPSDYPFAHARNPRLRWLHDFLLRVRPGPHRRTFMKPALRQAEFCAACHRTSYNLPQNQYKFLRTADDYGTWQAGPDSAQSIHTFTPPGPLRRCQDCHRPHTEHRTPEHLNPPPVTLDLLALRRPPRSPGAPEEWVAPLDQAKPVLRPGETVTIELVVRNRGVGHEFPSGSGTEAAWVELTAEDAAGRVLLHSGSAAAAEPTAATAPDPGDHAYGLIGLDRHGRRLEAGDLWNMVTPLYYRSLLPGQPDADRRTLQPGESDVVHYCLQVPSGATPSLILRACLWCRQGGPSGTQARSQWPNSGAAAGRRLNPPATSGRTPLKRAAGTRDSTRSLAPGAPFRGVQPDVAGGFSLRPVALRAISGRSRHSPRQTQTPPVPLDQQSPHPEAACPPPMPPVGWRLSSGAFVLAEDTVTLPVAAPPGTARGRQVLARQQAGKAAQPVRAGDHPPLADRFYDYGVGLLLQGDLPRAQRAMRRVQASTPREARGYFGLGRVYLTEGDLLAARAQFEQAARLSPADPRPQAFVAATERRMGQYDRALALLQPLARDHPRDRLLWFDIGMSRYLSGHYEEARRAFRNMLDIDPDDLSAHYNLMRCLRRLHRVSEARHEEVIYQSLREDDNARQIDLSYLHTHPLADRETRTVHAHPLLPVARDARQGTGRG